MKKLLFILFFAGLPLFTQAQEAEDSPAEPTITIREDDKGTKFYDYRVNGELVQIRVVPERGPEYYLVPSDGGGWNRQDQSIFLIPSWKILEW